MFLLIFKILSFNIIRIVWQQNCTMYNVFSLMLEKMNLICTKSFFQNVSFDSCDVRESIVVEDHQNCRSWPWFRFHHSYRYSCLNKLDQKCPLEYELINLRDFHWQISDEKNKFISIWINRHWEIFTNPCFGRTKILFYQYKLPL